MSPADEVAAEQQQQQHNPHTLALAWIKAWNSRDIEAILLHYAEDIVVCAHPLRTAFR